MVEQEALTKRFFGNSGTRRVVVVWHKDNEPDWDLLPGGPFDWGNITSNTLRLAKSILVNMGASDAIAMRYAQKLVLNVLSVIPRNRALILEEIDVLNGIGCKAIDCLCEVEDA